MKAAARTRAACYVGHTQPGDDRKIARCIDPQAQEKALTAVGEFTYWATVAPASAEPTQGVPPVYEAQCPVPGCYALLRICQPPWATEIVIICCAGIEYGWHTQGELMQRLSARLGYPVGDTVALD